MSSASNQPGIVIVDDEPLALDLLREYVEGDGRFAVVAACANGFEAVRAINEQKPAVAILDIQMPKLSGFEVIELLDHHPTIIFATAHDEFALRAFEIRAIDYLLKPYSARRLEEALNRVGAAGERAAWQELRDVARRETPLARVLVREGSNVDVIPVEKIDYVEARDDEICFVWGGRKSEKHQTMSEIEALLDPRRFVRVHRSYIVNVDRLSKIELYAKDSRIAILKDGTRLPISRAGYEKLRKLL